MCDYCVERYVVVGFTEFVKLGGALSLNLLIGGAINGWSRSNAGLTETIANVTASVYLYPATRSGFFVTGGVGVSSYHANTFPSSDGTGVGLTAGAERDPRAGRDVYTTAVGNCSFAA